MLRLSPQAIRQVLLARRQTTSKLGTRPISTTTSFQASGNDATSGWEGRHSDEHAVRRDGLDVQSEQSHQAMKKYASLEEGSQAISRLDEGDNKRRAKQDHPKAPDPVIGMNDERGKKGQ